MGQVVDRGAGLTGQVVDRLGGQVVDRVGYKRGGKVKKTHKAMVHKGEQVLTAKQAKAFKKKLNVQSSKY